MPLRSSEAHYRELQRLEGLAMVASRRAWGRLDFADLDGSFREDVGPKLLATLSAGQYAAASEGAAYIPRALAERGMEDAPEGVLRPRSLSGVASDGRSLTGLLRAPLIRTKVLIGSGDADPLAGGQSLLDRIVRTQVADAMRQADSVSMTVRPSVPGYVRVVNLPACGRCLVLAGRYYKTADSAGFLRHPACDCSAEPAEDRGDASDPKEGFDRMSRAEQDKAFGKDGAEAIRDGADMGRVVNARRGMSKTQANGRTYRTTTAGTTRRGRLPGQAQGMRLMPESIYELASDRADALRLLRRYGYIR